MLPGDAGITPPRLTTSRTKSAAYHGAEIDIARRLHHIAAAERAQLTTVHDNVAGKRRRRPPLRAPSKIPERNPRRPTPHDGTIAPTIWPASAGSQSAALMTTTSYASRTDIAASGAITCRQRRPAHT